MTDARMGEFLRDYEPHWTLHRSINDLLTTPVYAFSPHALIVQEKRYPDVSFYQGKINWDQMRSQTDTVIIRAGQGVHIDSEFMRNWTLSWQLGMYRGAYWFYDDRVSPGAQAQALVDLIRDRLPEMEIWIDWENSYGGSFGGLRNVVAMMQRVEELLPGVRVGMYTGYYFFREHSNSLTNAAQYNYLKTRPLWLAWYTENASLVLVPAPWTSLLLWQWGTPAVGPLYGVKSIEIDMSTFNGTLAEFTDRYGGTTTPPPDGGTMKQYRVVWSAGVARRTAPTTSNSSTSLPPYVVEQVVDVLEDNILDATYPSDPNKKWCKFVDGFYGASIYGAGSVRMIDVTPTTPPPSALPEIPVTIVLGDDITYIKQTIATILKPK